MIAKQESSSNYYTKTAYQQAGDKTVVAFVDLVGSTEKWARQPTAAAFPTVRDFHNSVLRHAKKNQGKPIKGIGDEVMLRFDDMDTSTACLNAIKAALGIQAALTKIHRPPVADDKNGKRSPKGLSCKIVIHYVKSAIRIGYYEQSGPPKLEALKRVRADAVNQDQKKKYIPEKYARDLVGHHVNVASRFTKIVRGGEILISKEAFSLLKATAKGFLSTNKEINYAGPTVIYGFRGMEDNPVEVFSLGKSAAIKAPQYPTQAILRVTLKQGYSDQKARKKILRAYRGDREIQGRCAWSAQFLEPGLDDHLVFKIGEFDLDAFEDFVTKKFYSMTFPGIRTLSTHTVFLRKDELPKKVEQMVSRGNKASERSGTREIWFVRLKELEKYANQVALEEWLWKAVSRNRVVLIDYMRTWGEFEAYLYVKAPNSSRLNSFYRSFTHECKDFAQTESSMTKRIKCANAI